MCIQIIPTLALGTISSLCLTNKCRRANKSRMTMWHEEIYKDSHSVPSGSLDILNWFKEKNWRWPYIVQDIPLRPIVHAWVASTRPRGRPILSQKLCGRNRSKLIISGHRNNKNGYHRGLWKPCGGGTWWRVAALSAKMTVLHISYLICPETKQIMCPQKDGQKIDNENW